MVSIVPLYKDEDLELAGDCIRMLCSYSVCKAVSRKIGVIAEVKILM